MTCSHYLYVDNILPSNIQGSKTSIFQRISLLKIRLQSYAVPLNSVRFRMLWLGVGKEGIFKFSIAKDPNSNSWDIHDLVTSIFFF